MTLVLLYGASGVLPSFPGNGAGDDSEILGTGLCSSLQSHISHIQIQ